MNQPKSQVILYIAVSLDGYIADAAGGVNWLEPYENVDYGFGSFIATVGHIVMGRTTFDQLLSFASWPYGELRGTVLTSRELPKSDYPVTAYGGPLSELVVNLTRFVDSDVWLLGGGITARRFLAEDLVDRIELFLVPVLLGEGIRLLPDISDGIRPRFRLTSVHTQGFPNGVVRVVYNRPIVRDTSTRVPAKQRRDEG